ncbi:hypothetical protein FVQ98_17635 [Ottowia sp. GY511]|uniref:Uncharacterized protein n=1 Tax=Ottowia flava TaxID=2675430 RepID=A0ABW4KXK1_9BURK|nr:hypothetical protein [Ottowia sp. GY511]TXK23279.1 hypothetical protein FVQ98_17635 [Ottowia sp. GY511]
MSSANDLPATDARARRAERLAVAQALPGVALDWAAIDACPAWLARSPAERELLCAHAGAWWLAASLRACIDGKRLTRVCEMLGEPRLNALREAPAIARAEALGQAPSSLLPSADDMPHHLLACGRALLGWSLPARARAPVLAAMGWAADDSHHAVFDAHADWAHQALEAALSDTAPAPTAADDGVVPELAQATDQLPDGAAPTE